MFQVKICGIRSVDDARVVAAAGGDAVGFNFYPQSARYLAPEAACGVASQLPPSVRKVGVFVDESPESIARVCRLVHLDGVQLHGDEPPASLAALPASVQVIRAFRLRAGNLGPALEYLSECSRRGRLPDAVLVDAYASGAYGGTGRTINWQELAAQKPHLGSVPLILAGGLTPENVRSAIDEVQPLGVDTASGVEQSPGVKDYEKIRQFVREAKAGLAGLSR